MPRMITWSDRLHYDIDQDQTVGRISGFDDHHQEHWLVIHAGKGYADRRKEALLKIMESIERGDEAGEVILLNVVESPN